MSWLIIAFIILLYTFQSFLCKKYSDTYPGESDTASPTFTIISGLTVIIVCFIVSGFTFTAKPLTLLMGAINGVALFGYNISLIKASGKGSYSILMVCNVSGGIIIPAIIASVFFKEPLSWIQILSILAVFVAVYMLSYKKSSDQEKTKNTRSFFLLCGLLALCNGAYGALLDAQQRKTGSDEREEMVAATYAFAVLFSLVTLLVKKKGRILPAFRQTKISFLYLIGCSLIVATAINALVYVLPLVNTTVLYTFDNAGVMLTSVLLSCIFFKEKLSKLNAAGCALMCVALIFLSIG